MKKEDWIGLLLIVIFGILLVIFLSIYALSLEQHFKITKSGSEVIADWKTTCIDIGNENCFSPEYDGVEWLDEYCECELRECYLHYNKSDLVDFTDNVSMTWYGPIEYNEDGSVLFYKPNAKVVEECGECEKYKCGEYTVEVFNQIK